MKLCSALCITWWFLHTVQSASLEDNLKQSENAIMEELEMEDFHQAMSHNEFMGSEENVPNPSERQRHVPRLPTPPDSDLCGHTMDNNFSNWVAGLPILGIDPNEYEYCGPYSTHYSNAQCPVVCERYGITVATCQEICERVPLCNAFNWSGKPRHGCVLRTCPDAANPPVPTGVNADFVSFSKHQPTEISQCKLPNAQFINNMNCTTAPCRNRDPHVR